jgi:hypothetical protein
MSSIYFLSATRADIIPGQRPLFGTYPDDDGVVADPIRALSPKLPKLRDFFSLHRELHAGLCDGILHQVRLRRHVVMSCRCTLSVGATEAKSNAGRMKTVAIWN